VNTKYFLKLLIISSILLTAFREVGSIGHGYPKNINVELIPHDTTRPLSSFLVISDIHLNRSASQKSAHGDSGDSLWMAAKEEIDTLIADKKPGFIIVLGDLPRHDTSTKRDSVKVRQNMEQVIKYFTDSANIPSDIPLIYVPGNNDSWNGDYSAFTLPDSIYKMYGYPFLHVDSEMASDHACIADDRLLRSIDCYSMYPLGKENKLKVIVLNTVIFTRNKDFPYSKKDTLRQSNDATNEINWLLQELERTSQNGEKVLIAMHVPPGVDGYTGNFMWYDQNMQNSFLEAIAKYHDNIIGLLSGHTHMDGIRLLRKDSVTSLLISIPGISPGHGNNPAMKVIEYNNGNFELKDFTTYYMDYWNPDGKGTLRNWDSSFRFSSIAPGYDISSMTMRTWFQKNNNKENIDTLVHSIYTDKSRKPEQSTFMHEITSSIYVDYQK
jgi:sphingomyelin phosphodiesterase acid-like 3